VHEQPRCAVAVAHCGTAVLTDSVLLLKKTQERGGFIYTTMWYRYTLIHPFIYTLYTLYPGGYTVYTGINRVQTNIQALPAPSPSS